jgi:hypothetical protein
MGNKQPKIPPPPPGVLPPQDGCCPSLFKDPGFKIWNEFYAKTLENEKKISREIMQEVGILACIFMTVFVSVLLVSTVAVSVLT